MRAVVLHYLPLLLAVTGSVGLHLAFYMWPFGTVRTVDPPPPERGPASIAVRLKTASASLPTPESPTPLKAPDATTARAPCEQGADLVESSASLGNAERASESVFEVPDSLIQVTAARASRLERAESATNPLPRPDPPAVRPRTRPAISAPAYAQAQRAARESQGAMSPPAVIANPEPRYPPELESRGIEGSVTVKFMIQTNGRATDLRIVRSSGYPAMDAEARRALKSWRFRPARRNGQPIAHPAVHTLRWKIEPVPAVRDR